MFRLGLYINDLSIHDSSRELVLAGTQQSVELKMLLDQVYIMSLCYHDNHCISFYCKPKHFSDLTIIAIIATRRKHY